MQHHHTIPFGLIVWTTRPKYTHGSAWNQTVASWVCLAVISPQKSPCTGHTGSS